MLTGLMSKIKKVKEWCEQTFFNIVILTDERLIVPGGESLVLPRKWRIVSHTKFDDAIEEDTKKEVVLASDNGEVIMQMSGETALAFIALVDPEVAGKGIQK
jgi:glutamine amidotransferase PdxT